MQGIIATAVKALKKQQESEAKNCIQRSKAKIKNFDVLGEQFHEQMNSFNEQARQFQTKSLYQQFGLDENSLMRGRKFGRVRIPKIPKDSFYDKSLSFFESINDEDENIDNINPQDHPFNSQLYEFMQYVQQEKQSLNKIQTSFYNLTSQVEKLLNLQTQRQKQTDLSKLQNDLKIYTHKNETLNKSYQLELRKDIQRYKRKKQQMFLIAHKMKQIITKNQEQMCQIQTLKEKLTIANSQLQHITNLKQSVQKKLTCDKFQISIIKLQGTNTLYRYGGKITKSQISKTDYLHKKNYKFQNKVKGISFLDLKIFILTALYPMASSVFNDFSSQSNIYKAMFDLNTLSKQEEESSLMILNKRIEKHLHQKKYHSLEDCLHSSVKTRKKKIIFIGSIERFGQIMGQVVTTLHSFNNNLLEITKVNTEQISNSFDGTNFSHHRLQISYSYQKVNLTVVFDVLFCVPTLVNKQQIEYLRKKAQKFEQVLIWFQIPKTQLQEQRIQTYKQINSMLSKCKLFHYSVQKAPIK